MSETITGWHRHAVEAHVPEEAHCPYCGSRNLLVEAICGTAVISCRDCLSVGPVTAAQSQAQAWARWNTRHCEGRDEADACAGVCAHLPHVPLDIELDDFV